MGERNDHEDPVPSEALDRGIEYAFGATPAGDESVLDALSRRAGVRPRVFLDDPPEEDSPLVRVSSSRGGDEIEDDPRYQVLGEIARGGVGVVFKSRDRDLGRDVALKVLRKDLAGMPEVVERFIEEAQIGGQLQHPGIVPVYGLGMQRDGRPFFAMKLVKGRTLAGLIRDRTDAGDGGRRLISHFERVCQTVAYAHARGVIHRDLKPSNVLIGAFGEVQVVDWGFAKVLARGGNADEPVPPDRSVIHTVRSGSDSASRVGSVMGTPAYMPPEQARGEVELLDERADVFSLGAILAEILTGLPPYAGDPSELVMRAAQADLDDATTRLDGCGADPELVALAKRCLAPARDARPRDAGVVAQAVSAHLAALGERIHEAELRTAAAHRTRRLSIALAAAILAAALGIGGGFWQADRTRHERDATAAQAVADALQEAAVDLGRARQADLRDVSLWVEALAAAKEAVAVAGRMNAPAASRSAAAILLAQVADEEAGARARAEREERDQHLAERLLRARELLLFPPQRPRDDVEPELEAAFREAGIDLADPSAAAKSIGESTRRTALVAALDTWRRLRIGAGADPAPVEAVLALVDPDENRQAIRTAERAKDAGALRALVPAEGADGLPGETLALLGAALGTVVDAPAALPVLRERQEAAPYDHDANLALGASLVAQAPLQIAHIQEAIAAFTRAAMEHREGVADLCQLAFAQGKLRMYDPAIASMRQACDLAPREPSLRKWLGFFLVQRSMLYHQAAAYHAAVADARAAVAAVEAMGADVDRVVLARVHCQLSNSLRELGDWAGVRDTVERALELDAGIPPHFKELLAEALARGGEMELALSTLEEVLGAGHTCIGARGLQGVVLCASGRLEEALAVFEAGAADEPGNYYWPMQAGRVLAFLDRPEEAVASLRRAVELNDAFVECHIYLAQALRRARLVEEARSEDSRAADLQEQTLLRASRRDRATLDQFQRWGLLLGRVAPAGEAQAALVRAFPDATSEEASQFRTGAAAAALYWRIQPDEASALLRAALDAEPRCVTAWSTLGWLLVHRADWEEAITAMRKAAECAGGGDAHHFSVYSVLMSAGRFDEAGAMLVDDCPPCRKEKMRHPLRVAAEKRIPEWLRGEWNPEGDETEDLASALFLTGRHAPLAPLVRRCLEEGPPPGRETDRDRLEWRVMLTEFGVFAASARAGDESLDAEERSVWRRQAAAWLEGLTAALREWDRAPNLLAADGRPNQAAWLFVTPRLAPIRDAERLADVPAEDREACNRAWAKVREYHDSVR